MRIVDLYKMSEDEQKKALQEQQAMYNERMQQSDEIRRQANQQFNNLISKQGEYDTTRHTTTIGELRNAYRNSSNYEAFNNSLNNYYNKNKNNPSIWERVQNVKNGNEQNQNKENLNIINSVRENAQNKNVIDSSYFSDRRNKMQEASNFLKEGKKEEAEKILNEMREKDKQLPENKEKHTGEVDGKEFLKELTERAKKAVVYGGKNAIIKDLSGQDVDYGKEFVHAIAGENSDLKAKELNKKIEKGGTEAVQAITENILGNVVDSATNATGSIVSILPTVGAGILENTNKAVEDYGNIFKTNKPNMQELQNAKKSMLGFSHELANASNEYNEANQKLDNDIVKTSGNVASTIGNMIPSIISNIIAPGSGILVQGLSAGGKTAEESINEEGSNVGQSIVKGIGYGTASGLIEKLTGGNFLGKGSLDDFATNFIGNKISSKLGQKIASKGYEFLGENLEEFLENQVDHAIDLAIEGKGVTKEQWLNETGETAVNTALTTAVLNMLGLGGNTYQEIQNNPNIDTNTKQVVKEINEAIDKNKLGGKEQLEQFINNKIDNNTAESQQQSTQNEQILPTQQINQEQNNMAQNGKINEFNGYTDKEINNIESNKITVAKSNEDIINFVNSSKKVPSNRKMYLGKIKENISNYINEKFGINIGNYNISLKTDAIRHTENNHTNLEKETSRGQIPLVAEDYANIPVIINNPDNVSIDGKTQQGKPVIKFEKNIDGNNVVVTYVSDKHNNLELQTMYKFKNNKKMNPATASNELNSLNRTSETNSGTDSFINNSIPPIGNNVNSDTITNNYAQSNENNTKNEQYQATKGETIDWGEMERPEGKIRKHYRSIIESSNTTAEAKAIAKEMMGLDTYTPQSNESLLQKADSRISTTNPETELKSLLSRVMNNEKVNDVDMAVGERLIEYYSKIGDSEHLQDAIHATALAGTQAGRTVQAMALLNHMTPQGQVVWLERSVNKANKELEQKFKNKKNIPQFELTSDMTEKVLNTKSKEEMYKVLDDVYEELGQQVPKTTLEKIDEWRYFSMLANVKTHGRNMIGNVAMNLTQRAKNKVAGAIEGTVAKFNPEMERTHTIVPTSKKVKDFAKNDVKNMDVQTELGMNENKYNPQSRLQSARRTFKSDVLENTLGKMFDLNSKLLEVEDNIGLKSMYVKSLGEYITANKIDIDNMTDAQLSKARQHAIKEAQEATFHQASALATALNQMGRKNNIAKFALDSAVPFKKTPINVAKTGVQYSPVGLIKSAVYDVGKLRKGDITVNQYIDNVSKGLTGTGIAYIGYVLAESGILKASGSDDDKKEKYEEEQGKQSYSIEIGGKTYSLDWLSPVGIPLFIGAEINQQFNTSKKEKNSKSNDDNEALNQIVQSVANIANASANAMNPMSEMSMISGLTSVLSSYNKENAVGDMIVNTGKSYINQFVPTALGQLARTTDDYERTTKSTKTGALEKAVDSTINQIKSKIPGLRQTLPTKTDIWGKDIKQDANLPFRAFNNFINPSKVQDVSTDKVDKELNSLYAKTGEGSIIPKAIDKKFNIDGTEYRMTDKEYAKYYKKYGETSYKLIKELINSNDYKDLTNEQKQKAIEEIYSYANKSNKRDYAKNNNIKIEEKSTIYDTLEELKSSKSQINYLSYLAKTNDIQGEEANKKKLAILNDSNYSDSTKNIIYKNTLGKNDKTYDSLNKITNININAYMDYKLQDIKGEEDSKSKVQGKTVSGSKKENVYNYLKNSNLSTVERLYIYGTSYKLDNKSRGILQNTINNSSLTQEEKLEIYGRLTANVEKYKDGTYHWK